MIWILVLIIVSGCVVYLVNLIFGFQVQICCLDEFVIVVMQQDDYFDLFQIDFLIWQFCVFGDELFLVLVCNVVVDVVIGDILLFIDVDCIFELCFVQDYLDCMQGQCGLFMGEVLYLLGGVMCDGLDFDCFVSFVVCYFDRVVLFEIDFVFCFDYCCFWFLNFVMYW